MKFARAFTVLLVLLVTSAPAHATDWYFDKDSVGGICSNTGPGTKSQPFCSIFTVLWDRVWNGAQAGDTIYIRRGTYSGRLFWIKAGVLNNGTPSAPITIRPYPGETVVFDGGAVTDYLFKFAGTANYVHDLHFIGPFEAKNYNIILDGDTPADGFRTNLVFDRWKIHDVSMGFLLRHVKNVTVRNSTFYELKGLPTTIADNVIGVSVRGDAVHISDNVTIENCVVHDVNDGKGNDNGDADGFHTDQYVDRFTIRNSSAYRCSEDGMDTKARRVLLENVRVWDNGATGIKMWGGNVGVPSTYTIRRALTYGNTETGIKCTGWGDAASNQVTATVDHLTSWGNGEDGIKLSPGTDTSQGCTVTLRNSIIGATGASAVTIGTPKAGYGVTLNLSYLDILHTGSMKPINAVGCSLLSAKYTIDQFLGGAYNTDLAGGFNCGGTLGTITGTSTRALATDPNLENAQPAFEWASIAQAAVTGSSLLLATEASYPWPNPAVGHFIEINDDGVKRQITAVGDAVMRTINFAPAVAATVCGRATDCRGVRIVGWAAGTPHSDDMHLSPGSPAIDAALWVSGLHCAQADDLGGTGLTDCVHWRGVAPDLGFYEYGMPILGVPQNPQPGP